MNFLRKYQKILYFSFVLLIGIFFAYLIISFIFQAKPVDNSGTELTGTSTVLLPKSGERATNNQSISDNPSLLPNANDRKVSAIANGDLTQVNQISTTTTGNFAIDQVDSSLKYYDKTDGRFYKLSKSGQKTLMSDKVFYNANNITWSKISDKAIIEYPDESNIIYDFDKQKQTTMPKHWQDFHFSPTSDQIVMKSIGLDPENRWLAITNGDGSQEQALEELGTKEKTIHPSWSPNDRIVALQVEGRSLNRQEVFLVGKNKENFKSTIVEGRDFRSQWSPDGTTLLYSVYSSDNEFKPKLWVVNANGDTVGDKRVDLGLETWSDKCIFGTATEVYCAVPQDLPVGAGLAPEVAKNIPDSIYKVNINTGTRKLIAIPDGSFNVKNINLSADGRNLYFTNSGDEKIYNIKLK